MATQKVIQNTEGIESTRGELYRTFCPACGAVLTACGLTFSTTCCNCGQVFGICEWCKFLDRTPYQCGRRRVTKDDDLCTLNNLLLVSRLEVLPDLPSLEES